jgi:hypothetical protein
MYLGELERGAEATIARRRLQPLEFLVVDA